MKNYLALLGTMLSCMAVVTAQTSGEIKRSAVSLELGKTGLIYNGTFDHRLSAVPFGLRVSAGSNLGRYLQLISFGGGAYYLAGKTNKFLELGLDLHYLVVNEISDDQKGVAAILTYPNYSTESFYPSVNLGYRRYGTNTLFRIGLSPGLIDRKLKAGGYVSYGFAF